MRKIAAFVISGYPQALAAVTGFTLLSALLPVVGLLGGGCIALIALKLDWRRACSVIAGACAVLAALALLAGGWQAGVPVIITTSLLQWLPLTGFAWILRRHHALAWPLTAALAVAAAGVLAALPFAELNDWWREALRDYTVLLAADERLTAALEAIVPVMTGIALASLVMVWSLMLLLGRWWQSLLDAPGRFRDEFTALQIGRGIAILSLAVFAVATQAESAVWKQLAIVAAPPFLLQGVAVVHGLLAGLEQRRLPLAAFYTVLAVITALEPRLWLLVVLIGLVESLFGLRRRFAPANSDLNKTEGD